MKANIHKQTTALCGHCGKSAVVQKKTDKLPDGVEHTYFQCAECGHKATVAYTDAEIRAAMKDQQRRFREDRKAAEAAVPQLQAMIDTLKRKYEPT